MDKETFDPCDFDLKFTATTPLSTPEPSEYVTEIQGRIMFDDLAQTGGVCAGCIKLILYDLERALNDGQSPFEVFDCMSESAVEFYQQIYNGFELLQPALKAIGLEELLNPSLLVIEAIELLPDYRGFGLGLAAVLKAMHVFGPAYGIAALMAAPLELGVAEDVDQAS